MIKMTWNKFKDEVIIPSVVLTALSCYILTLFTGSVAVITVIMAFVWFVGAITSLEMFEIYTHNRKVKRKNQKSYYNKTYNLYINEYIGDVTDQKAKEFAEKLRKADKL